MNGNLKPIQVALHPAMSLGRGGGGFGGGGRSFERGFGVMTHKAPFENGMCGPNEEVGADGTCQPIMQMGQAAPAAPTDLKSVGVTALVVGLGAGVTQLLTGDGSMLNKVAFWTEIAAMLVLAGVVVGGKS